MKIRKRHEKKNAAVQDSLYKPKFEKQKGKRNKLFFQRPTIWAVVATTVISCALLNTFFSLLVLKFSWTSGIDRADYKFITELHDPYEEEKGKTKSSYYRLTNDSRYHYEFRYEYNVDNTSDDHRLMILFNGRGRICADYWQFCVGRRIVGSLRKYGFSILAICAEERVLDIYSPIYANEELEWIYTALQIWMNTVYYKRFHRYPRLFVHGISQGSGFGTLLSRVMPIQAQILFATTGNYLALTARSIYSKEMQTRFILDPTFASWFYFDFCYNAKGKPVYNQSQCPFQGPRRQFYPVPPTFFMVPKADPFLPLAEYIRMQNIIKNDSLHLGGKLLHHNISLGIDIIYPRNLTPTYMLENFDLWSNKSYASRIFYEYMQEFGGETNMTIRGTCRCSPINFTYWDGFPNVTSTWPARIQAEHRDYVRDVTKYRGTFCEDICGDLLAYHAMSSRNLDNALEWCNKIDNLRQSLRFKDYLSRPLRLWMYDKKSITNDTKRFSTYKIDWSKIAKQYEIYSSEYHLQDYFYKLKTPNKTGGHNLTWTSNPLLADYFVIPSDFIFFYFDTRPDFLNETQFESVRQRLNDGYFDKILMNIHKRYPYWTMVPTVNQTGSNHIIVLPEPKHMELFNNKSQQKLKNVIKLVFTGTTDDLFVLKSRWSEESLNVPVNFKTGYDIVIPRFTRLRLNLSDVGNWNMSLSKKKYLFHFSDNINHSSSLQTIQTRLKSLSKEIQRQEYEPTIEIQGKSYATLIVSNSSTKEQDYIEAVQSSIFSICYEDYLPWSACTYEAIQLGVIPLILAQNIIFPFERFVNWEAFSLKIDANTLASITDSIKQLENLDAIVKEKLSKLRTHVRTFRWPYGVAKQKGQFKHIFLPAEDQNKTKNAFHYLALELRCRRLEQLYGLTPESLSKTSIKARKLACNNHAKLCPCQKTDKYLASDDDDY